MSNDLDRFVIAQQTYYAIALDEIKDGRKRSHWMWFIFPQIEGLGFSDMARRYAIRNMAEASAYLAHPILGPRLIEISKALLTLKENNATRIMGRPDYMKLRSSMSLFSLVPGGDAVFEEVLQKFFDDRKDNATMELLK